MVTPTEIEPGTDVAASIADALGETERQPRALVARVVSTLGEARAQELLAKTREIEASGGLMTLDGERRRTPGGVFLFLAKQDVRDDTRRFFKIFGLPAKAKKPAGTPAKRHQVPKPKAAPKPPSDEAIAEAIEHLEFGEARQVKVVLTGRPKRIEQRGDAVIIGLRSERAPNLPKGLPEAPTGTAYAVFISKKMWQAVASALQRDPEDILVIEAFPTLHPKFSAGVTCFATMVTTAGLQRAKREAQKEVAR